jgi:hypothetical protein
VAALPKAALLEIEGIAVLQPVGVSELQTGWREAFDQTKGQ